MRIRRTTTQMVNNSRRRAGLTARRSPLLSRATQNNGKGTVSRLDMMNANSLQSSRMARVGFEKLQKSASSLEEQMLLLSDKAENGKEIGATAANVVEDFNDTLKYLQENSSVLNNYYRQSMSEIAASNKTDLSEIGITVGRDGTLVLDKAKLEQADAETVKRVLGASGDFAKRISSVASRVADNAKVNMENVSSQYNSAGSVANSYLNRFNLWG